MLTGGFGRIGSRTPLSSSGGWMQTVTGSHCRNRVLGAGRFPGLRAVALRPAVMWEIYLASAGQAHIGPAGAKLAELLLASVDATATP